jgi:hypothetical protein
MVWLSVLATISLVGVATLSTVTPIMAELFVVASPPPLPPQADTRKTAVSARDIRSDFINGLPEIKIVIFIQKTPYSHLLPLFA